MSSTGRIRSLTVALLLAVMALTLAACAPSNTVRLMYQPPDANILPAPGAPSVAVVMFDDPRHSLQIGERRDGTPFVASAPVSDWIARNLADELARQGLQVSYASTIEQARAANPDFIVTGTVGEVNLRELNTTDYTATIKATVTLSGRKGRIFTENLSSSQNQQVLPSSQVTEKILSSTLRDLLQPVARKVNDAVK